MAKVYARLPGAEIRIGNHGTATNDRPAVVPEDVALELVAAEGLRIEPDGIAVVPAGVYATREELDVAIEETVERARASRPKSVKE